MTFITLMEGDLKMSDEAQIVAPHTIAQIVKGTTAEFSHYKEDKLFYTVDVEEFRYEFPIDITNKADIGDTTLDRTYKAITLMRYIRKAISDGKIRWDKII